MKDKTGLISHIPKSDKSSREQYAEFFSAMLDKPPVPPKSENTEIIQDLKAAGWVCQAVDCADLPDISKEHDDCAVVIYFRRKKL
jgi:hypothetical protein